MLPRWPIYGLGGWLMIAAVASFAHASHLTLVLPMVSVIFLGHAVLTFHAITPRQHLILALILGYLDDLHHQAIVGSSTLGHAAACGVALWAGLRFSTHGVAVRMMVCGAMALMVNLVIAGVALASAPRLGLSREVVIEAWPQILWQTLATTLVVFPLWQLIDRVLRFMRLAPTAKVRESQTEVLRP